MFLTEVLSLSLSLYLLTYLFTTSTSSCHTFLLFLYRHFCDTFPLHFTLHFLLCVTLFSPFFIGISVTLHPYRSPPLLTTAAAAPFFKASYTDAPTKDPLPGAACSNRGAFQTSLFKKYRPRAPSYKAAAAFSLAARLAM